MISSVNEIVLNNNHPTNVPVNELKLYLYGLPISSADSWLILMAAINFIKNTNRFSH